MWAFFLTVKKMSAVISQTFDDEISEEKFDVVAHDVAAIVVIGTGPVGMRFVEELINRGIDKPVVVYGGESDWPYDRVRLSSYLAGDVLRDELNIEPRNAASVDVEYRYNCPITWIDKKNRIVIDAEGGEQKYSSLVMAVGSEPFIPFFGNNNYRGIFTFRTLYEADALLARKTRTSHTVIIGGGLLGLETARAMQQYNTRITIIEHNRWLMMNQLDEPGASYLQSFIEATGIKVILGDNVVSVVGNQRVESVTLRSGIELSCDTLIVAAGVRPKKQLALDTGLICKKGICIDDHLQTSQKGIYAIGECAEHENAVYGLVKPGLDQATVLAERLAGGQSRYKGSLDATRLKVINQSVFSSGRTGVDEVAGTTVKEIVYVSKAEGIYRKIRIFGNRIIGVIAVGDWHEAPLIQAYIQEKRKVWFWHVLRFKTTGNLWGDADAVDVSTWPATAVVCNCTGVTHGRLNSAINSGCETVACLATATRASTVCGSCKPLLAEMLGEEVRQEPVRAWRSLLAVSALTLTLAALFFFVWRIPYADSVQVSVRWDELWRDSLLKQISGFSMLAMMLMGLIISLRKRMQKFKLGDYNLWRISHVVLGIGALLGLIVHTGFRFGDELNFILMMNFIVLTIVGANASTVIATEHQQVPAQAKKQRRRWNNLHLLLFWPLPVLLGFHVVKTYYF